VQVYRELTRSRPREFGNQLAYALQGLSLVLVNCQRIDRGPRRHRMMV